MTLSITTFSIMAVNAKCCYADGRLCWNAFYDECRKQAHYTECHYVECHYAECHYAECRYAECHVAESMM
jgi:hypothetical protein